MKKTGILLSTVLILSSCVSQNKYKELEHKYYAALQGQSKTKKEVDEKEEELKMMQNQYLSLQEQQAALADKKVNLDKEYQKLQQEYSDKLKAMEELEDKNSAISNAAELSEGEKRKLSQELQQAKTELQEKIRRINELENLISQQKESVATLKDKLKNALKSYEGKGITVEEKEGNIYISMDNKLLFPSASWVVEKEGMLALKEISAVLERDKELNIVVQGHTDSDRYAGSGSVKDNWDLSVMRATAVTKILQTEGVSPEQITASGRSEYLPIADNSTIQGKAINRRVDIIIAPDLREINKLLNEL